MGLIARVLEAEGVATVCVVMNREIAAHVKPPRTLHVRFPYGAPLGPAQDTTTQLAVVRAALDLLSTGDSAGEIVNSPVDWPL